jgi:hypothetical protein
MTGAAADANVRVTIEPWSPGLTIVERFEAQIVMPAGASPLGAYTRTYQGTVVRHHHMVDGQFVLAGDRKVHFGIFQIFPPGSSCRVILADFDTEEDKVSSVQCVGE